MATSVLFADNLFREKINEATAVVRQSAMTKWLALVVAFVVTFAFSAIGAQFSPGEWYRTLEKPALNPPNWIFGPVWTALYATMAVAVWMVWCKSDRRQVRWALTAYGIQLVLNAAWSWLFFGRHQIGVALLDIVVLWAAILWTIVLFWRIKRSAAMLLVPYLLWVSFAAFLNLRFWQLNS
ncbi:MAG: tryptophan-rich sensory protein [Planctomycetaceae bacterium]|nr:tryptophan-rich sensory protein [Planctomycetaceae bacterium]